jgi:hypothetical protein
MIMRVLLTALVAVVSIATSSCAKGPISQVSWTKRDITDERLKIDTHECERDSYVAGDSRVRRQRLFNKCMEARGYMRVE